MEVIKEADGRPDLIIVHISNDRRELIEQGKVITSEKALLIQEWCTKKGCLYRRGRKKQVYLSCLKIYNCSSETTTGGGSGSTASAGVLFSPAHTA